MDIRKNFFTMLVAKQRSRLPGRLGNLHHRRRSKPSWTWPSESLFHLPCFEPFPQLQVGSHAGKGFFPAGGREHRDGTRLHGVETASHVLHGSCGGASCAGSAECRAHGVTQVEPELVRVSPAPSVPELCLQCTVWIRPSLMGSVVMQQGNRNKMGFS